MRTITTVNHRTLLKQSKVIIFLSDLTHKSVKHNHLFYPNVNSGVGGYMYGVTKGP